MRAAKFCQGWIPAVLTPAEVTEGLGVIRSIAEANGRELPADFDVAPQLSVSIGKDTRDAINRFEQSQLYAHMRSLSKSTLKDQDTSDFVSRNLIGNGEQMLEQVHAYAEAGVTTLSALLFACNTVEETLDNMAWFSENVIQPYRRATGGAGDHP
jgi:alkanesulfonate monooxygenase SsuD/methylene tetrahydromethanopterin reductase-like flavin-dependent oxidoreductase (luciferase family)